MNIKARIVARKMVLTYLYEKYTSHAIAENDHILKEICDIDITNSALEQKDEMDTQTLAKSLNETFTQKWYDADMTYIAKNCFEKWSENGIDADYIDTMIVAYDKYADKLPDLINAYASTFRYEDMDIMDRAIFLLWYAEFKLMKTPKEVILNETIELAKKYGDQWSPKLINWILHKVITAEEEVQKDGGSK